MNINKDSLVTSVCGMKSSITLEKLLTLLEKYDSFYFGGHDDRGEVIESLSEDSEDGYIHSDNWYRISPDLEFNFWDDGLREIKTKEIELFLKDIFGEEYYVMKAISFWFSHDDTENETICAEFEIDSEDMKLKEIIKNIDCIELDKIKKENFLTSEEREKLNLSYDELDFYSGDSLDNKCLYFMEKRDFKKDEWWKGWRIVYLGYQ